MSIRFFSRLLFLCIVFVYGCKLERLEPPCPSILSIQPTGGRTGDIVKIIGNGFIVGSPHLYTVDIGTSSIEVMDVPDSNTMRFKVPSGVGNGPVSLSLTGTTPCNTTQDIQFTYYYTATMVRDLTSNSLNGPRGLDLDKAGNLVVADPGNFIIRVIDTATGEIASSIGGGTGGCNENSTSLESASFLSPFDIDVDLSGNIWIPESGSMVIRWIDAGFREAVQVYAGQCGEYSTFPNTGKRRDVKLFYPESVAYDDTENVLYFTDAHGVKKIEDDNVVVHTPTPSDGRFYGIAISRSRKDAGPIFVSDHGTPGTVPPSIKSINELGTAKKLTYKSGQNTLNSPRGLAVDNAGNIFIVDIALDCIFVLYTDGTLDLLSGKPGDRGYVDKVPGLQARFNFPDGIALNEKDGRLVSIYISDSGNNAVRAILLN
jgi:sugar lactone lactonase YvrE